jgi:hypothetical protein
MLQPNSFLFLNEIVPVKVAGWLLSTMTGTRQPNFSCSLLSSVSSISSRNEVTDRDHCGEPVVSDPSLYSIISFPVLKDTDQIASLDDLIWFDLNLLMLSLRSVNR